MHQRRGQSKTHKQEIQKEREWERDLLLPYSFLPLLPRLSSSSFTASATWQVQPTMPGKGFLSMLAQDDIPS